MFTIVNFGLFTFVNMGKEELIHKQPIELARTFQVPEIKGRYLIYDHIEQFLLKAGKKFKLEELGKSTLGVPIQTICLGTGSIRILAWSQMHGNETTTTKAVLDIINAFYSEGKKPFLREILSNCTLTIIPMLNPDGAKLYTRQNANGVDLNRDASMLKEKESRMLKGYFDYFKPDFCFNLHDQRTIFSAGNNPIPCTISFLTPAMNAERSITPSRIKSMQVIVAMAEDLNLLIPNQIGRYDDAFNLNCTGDTFQSAEVPTVLFEAGHYQDDYKREKTREFMAAAILSGLKAIAAGSYMDKDFQNYFKLPENEKLFNDVILRNCSIEDEIVDVAIQFEEILSGQEIIFSAVVEKIGADLPVFGHREIDCQNNNVKTIEKTPLSENVIVDKVYIKNDFFTII